MVEVIPGILEQTYTSIVEKIRLVEGFVEWVQVDLLDGTLFGNTNFHNPASFDSLRTPLSLELHMMIVNPEQMIIPWKKAGIKRFIGHVEGMSEVEKFIATVRGVKGEVGLAIDIDTDVTLLKPFLHNIDCVLVMAINTGKSGQVFQEKAVSKINIIHNLVPDLPIEVDGGVNPETARRAVLAGATRLVTTSYLFNAPSLLSALHKLQSL